MPVKGVQPEAEIHDVTAPRPMSTTTQLVDELAGLHITQGKRCPVVEVAALVGVTGVVLAPVHGIAVAGLGGLRAVYRTLRLPGKNPLKDAHAELDRAVMAAYGFSAKEDLLAQLLALNLEVAQREAEGQPVTAPGIPPGHPNPARLITDDCIRAE